MSQRSRAAAPTTELPLLYPEAEQPITELSLPPESLLGGKGHKLAAMTAAGFPVPSFVCVTTAAFDRAMEPVSRALHEKVIGLEKLSPEAPEDRERIKEVAAGARAIVRGAPLPEALSGLLGARFEGSGKGFYSVRSSVVGEDSGDDSFAGQMDTHLWVPAEEVEERIRDCMASAYSDRAMLYRVLRGLCRKPVSAAVVVQAMVDADVAGVVFTADPTTGDRDRFFISAGIGLGEGIVGGSVETDTFITRPDGRRVSEEIAVKDHRVVLDRRRGKGTALRKVPKKRREAPALSDERVVQLAKLSAEVAAWAKSPQDIEWALEADGSLHLLQTRPITTLPSQTQEPVAVDVGHKTIFDNSNIVESYPGISSPLTFSFVRVAYRETFEEALRLIGVSPKTLEAEADVFENLVSLVDGRIYYNILNWYRLFQLLGLESALPVWEEALGLDRAIHRPPPRSKKEKIARLPEDLRIRSRLFTNLFRLNGKVERYLHVLDRVQERIFATDLDKVETHGLLELIREAESELLRPYGVSVINDLYTQQLYALVKRLLERFGFEDAERLRDGLVAGEAELDSVLPVLSLFELADAIAADDEVRSWLRSDWSAEEVWTRLHSLPQDHRIRQAVDRHLRLYGDRTVHELKLETPSMREDPSLLIASLRNCLDGGRRLHPGLRGDERKQTIREIEGALRRRPMQLAALRKAVDGARSAIRNRENLRLARTRAFGIVKRIYRAIGRRFESLGLIASAEDVFYLTTYEIEGTVRGYLVDPNLRALVSLRKEEYRGLEDKAPPPRIEVDGTVHARAPSEAADGAAHEGSASELRGTGASPGKITGEARVVLRPDEPMRIDGEILVAPMTDPGWVFLMVSAGGLVVEKGSILSHTAIIGRELGVPTVVGVTNATRVVRDGERLAVDGREGSVRRIDA